MNSVWWDLAMGGLAARTIWTVAMLEIIWSDYMTTEDMILSCPAEYFPMLLALGAIVALLVTGIRSMLAYSEQSKVVARTKGEKLAYGLNYLGENIAVVIVGALMTPILAGGYYDLAESEPTLWGIVTIGAVVAVVVALIGDVGCKQILESFRNRSKTAEALTSTEKKTE